jgi:hypothetical protein
MLNVFLCLNYIIIGRYSSIIKDKSSFLGPKSISLEGMYVGRPHVESRLVSPCHDNSAGLLIYYVFSIMYVS